MVEIPKQGLSGKQYGGKPTVISLQIPKDKLTEFDEIASLYRCRERSGTVRITRRIGGVVMKLLICLMILTFCTVAVSATTYSDGYFKFMVEDGGITITSYFGREESVNIPNQIAGVPVSKIASGAFVGTSAKAVYLPDTIMEIAEGAFAQGIKVYYAAGGMEPTIPPTDPVPTEPQATSPTGPQDGGTQIPTEPQATSPTGPQNGGTQIPTEPVKTPGPVVNEVGPTDKVDIDFSDDEAMNQNIATQQTEEPPGTDEPGKTEKPGEESMAQMNLRWIYIVVFVAAAAVIAIIFTKKANKQGGSKNERN